jgi:predicted Zn-dependent peptidase
MPITTTTLQNNLTIVAEPIPGVGSAAITWLIPTGSARDPQSKLGLSAITAELLLRGSSSLDARQQADAFDNLGASRGACVETFHHSISCTTLGLQLSSTLPLLADMVLDPRFDADSFAPSQELCLQAVHSLQDDPQDRVMLNLRANHAPSPINRSALGSLAGLEATSLSDIKAHWQKTALPTNSIFAVAGDIDPDAIAKQLESLTSSWTGSSPEVTWDPSKTNRAYHHEQDETNQVHIALAYDAPAESDPDCWLERVTTAILSGGMSCRLFTEVREKRSLCYSVYASYAGSQKYGRATAYVGTTPERAQESLDVLTDQLERINTPEGKVTQSEFDRAVVGLKSRLVMSGESTGARAGALARDQFKLGAARSLADLTTQLEAVTLDKINDYLSRRSLGATTISTLGPAALNLPATLAS